MDDSPTRRLMTAAGEEGHPLRFVLPPAECFNYTNTNKKATRLRANKARRGTASAVPDGPILPMRPTRLSAATVRPVPDLKGFSYDLLWEVPLDELFLASDFSARWSAPPVLSPANAVAVLGTSAASGEPASEGQQQQHQHQQMRGGHRAGGGGAISWAADTTDAAGGIQMRRGSAAPSSSGPAAAMGSSGRGGGGLWASEHPTGHPTTTVATSSFAGSHASSGASRTPPIHPASPTRGEVIQPMDESNNSDGSDGKSPVERRQSTLAALFSCCFGRRSSTAVSGGSRRAAGDNGEAGDVRRRRGSTAMPAAVNGGDGAHGRRHSGSGAAKVGEQRSRTAGPFFQSPPTGAQSAAPNRRVPLLHRSDAFLRSPLALCSVFRRPVPIEYVGPPLSNSAAQSQGQGRSNGGGPMGSLASMAASRSSTTNGTSAASPPCVFPSPSSENRRARPLGGEDDSATHNRPPAAANANGNSSTQHSAAAAAQPQFPTLASYAAVTGHWARLEQPFPQHHCGVTTVGGATPSPSPSASVSASPSLQAPAAAALLAEARPAPHRYSANGLPYRGVRSPIFTIGDVRLQASLAWSRHLNGGINGKPSGGASPQSAAALSPSAAGGGVEVSSSRSSDGTNAFDLLRALALRAEADGGPTPAALCSYGSPQQQHQQSLQYNNNSSNTTNTANPTNKANKHSRRGSAVGPPAADGIGAATSPSAAATSDADPFECDTLSFMLVALDDAPSATNLHRSLGISTAAVVAEFQEAVSRSLEQQQQQQREGGGGGGNSSVTHPLPIPERAYLENIAAERCFMQLVSQGDAEAREVARRLGLLAGPSSADSFSPSSLAWWRAQAKSREVLSGMLPGGALSPPLAAPVNAITRASRLAAVKGHHNPNSKGGPSAAAAAKAEARAEAGAAGAKPTKKPRAPSAAPFPTPCTPTDDSEEAPLHNHLTPPKVSSSSPSLGLPLSHPAHCDAVGCSTIDKATNPYDDAAIYALNYTDQMAMNGESLEEDEEEEEEEDAEDEDGDEGGGGGRNSVPKRRSNTNRGGGGGGGAAVSNTSGLGDTSKMVNANGSIVGGVAPTAMGIDLASTAVIKANAKPLPRELARPRGASNAHHRHGGGGGGGTDRELEQTWERRCSYQVELLSADATAAAAPSFSIGSVPNAVASAAAGGLPTFAPLSTTASAATCTIAPTSSAAAHSSVQPYAARKRVAEGTLQSSRRSMGFLDLHPLSLALRQCAAVAPVPEGYHGHRMGIVEVGPDGVTRRVEGGNNYNSGANKTTTNLSCAIVPAPSTTAASSTDPTDPKYAVPTRYVIRLRIRVSIGHGPSFLTHLRYFYFLHTHQRIMRAVRVREVRLALLVAYKANQRARQGAREEAKRRRLRARLDGREEEDEDEDRDNGEQRQLVSKTAHAAALEASPIARGGNAAAGGSVAATAVNASASPPKIPSLRRPPVVAETPQKHRKQLAALEADAESPEAATVAGATITSKNSSAQRRHVDANATASSHALQQQQNNNNGGGVREDDAALFAAFADDPTEQSIAAAEASAEAELLRGERSAVEDAVAAAERALTAHPLAATHYGRTGLYNHGITCFVNAILQICFHSGVLRWDVAARARPILARVAAAEAEEAARQEDVRQQHEAKQKRYGTHGLGVSSDEDDGHHKSGNKSGGHHSHHHADDKNAKKKSSRGGGGPHTPAIAPAPLEVSGDDKYLLALESVFRRLEGWGEPQLLAAGFGPVLIRKYSPERCVAARGGAAAILQGAAASSSPSAAAAAPPPPPLSKDVAGDLHTPAEMVGTMPLLEAMGLPPTQQEDAHEFLSFQLLPAFFSHLTKLHTIPIEYVTVPATAGDGDGDRRQHQSSAVVLSRRKDVLMDVPLVVSGCPTLADAMAKEFSYGQDTVPYAGGEGGKTIEAKRRAVIDVSGAPSSASVSSSLLPSRGANKASLHPLASTASQPPSAAIRAKAAAIASVLPPILIMHAKRFDAHLRKIHVRQRYPFLLSAAAVLATAEAEEEGGGGGSGAPSSSATAFDDEDPYVLFAVVAHHGNHSDSGHYTCYVRTPVPTIPAPSRRFLGAGVRRRRGAGDEDGGDMASDGMHCAGGGAFEVFDTDADAEAAEERVRQSVLRRAASKSKSDENENYDDDDSDGSGDVYFHYDDELVHPVPFQQFAEHIGGTHWSCPSSSAYILWYVRREAWRTMRRELIRTAACGVQQHPSPSLTSSANKTLASAASRDGSSAPSNGKGGKGPSSFSSTGHLPSDDTERTGAALYSAIVAAQRAHIDAILGRAKIQNDKEKKKKKLRESLEGEGEGEGEGEEEGGAEEETQAVTARFIPAPSDDPARAIVAACLAPPTIPIRGGYRVRSVAAWEEALERHLIRQRPIRNKASRGGGSSVSGEGGIDNNDEAGNFSDADSDCVVAAREGVAAGNALGGPSYPSSFLASAPLSSAAPPSGRGALRSGDDPHASPPSPSSSTTTTANSRSRGGQRPPVDSIAIGGGDASSATNAMGQSPASPRTVIVPSSATQRSAFSSASGRFGDGGGGGGDSYAAGGSKGSRGGEARGGGGGGGGGGKEEIIICAPAYYSSSSAYGRGVVDGEEDEAIGGGDLTRHDSGGSAAFFFAAADVNGGELAAVMSASLQPHHVTRTSAMPSHSQADNDSSNAYASGGMGIGGYPPVSAAAAATGGGRAMTDGYFVYGQSPSHDLSAGAPVAMGVTHSAMTPSRQLMRPPAAQQQQQRGRAGEAVTDYSPRNPLDNSLQQQQSNQQQYVAYENPLQQHHHQTQSIPPSDEAAGGRFVPREDPSSVFSTPSPLRGGRRGGGGGGDAVADVSVGGIAVDFASPPQQQQQHNLSGSGGAGGGDYMYSHSGAPPLPKGQAASATPARSTINNHHHDLRRYAVSDDEDDRPPMPPSAAVGDDSVLDF